MHYKINAYIDEETDIINAEQTLVYWNNSPDTLEYVYFHLYQNAFQPDSYLDELQKQNKKVLTGQGNMKIKNWGHLLKN